MNNNITIIIIVLLLLWATYSGSISEGFIDNATEIRAFPLHNPFTARFYTPINHIYSVIADSKHHEILRKIIGSTHRYATVPDKNIIQMVDSGNYDFAVVPKLLIPGNTVDNVRFVTGLHQATATLLGPNDSNLIDIGDFQHYSCPVTIGVLKGPDQVCLNHLLREAEAPAQIILFESTDELMRGYNSKYMLYFGLTDLRKRDPVINALTEKMPSHFLSMRKINKGTYHITYEETTFYKTHPYYQKEMIDLVRAKQQYPFLGSVGHIELYIPSVKTQYALICHTGVPKKKIKSVMSKVLRLLRTDEVFKGITISEMNLGRSAVEFHPIARRIFNQLTAFHGNVSSIYSNSTSP